MPQTAFHVGYDSKLGQQSKDESSSLDARDLVRQLNNRPCGACYGGLQGVLTGLTKSTHHPKELSPFGGTGTLVPGFGTGFGNDLMQNGSQSRMRVRVRTPT